MAASATHTSACAVEWPSKLERAMPVLAVPRNECPPMENGTANRCANRDAIAVKTVSPSTRLQHTASLGRRTPQRR
jgi:hypothetical protein